MPQDDITTAYLKMKSRLTGLVSLIIKQPLEIEDILQDAYIKTYTTSKKQKIRSPEAFLTHTARNLALNHIALSRIKYSSPIGENDEQTVIDNNMSIEDNVDSQNRFLHLCVAVRNLPPQCKKVFIMTKVYGMSYQEASEQLTISKKTIEKHVAKGVKACTKYLDALEDKTTKKTDKSTIKVRLMK